LREVYLDNSATTKVCDAAAKAAFDVMTRAYGNPSSLHGKGLEAEKLMKRAREAVAISLGVGPAQVYFTSGGTESNNMAIKGVAYALRRRGTHLITTSIEHPSVLDAFKHLESEGFSVTYLDVDGGGYIDLEDLQRALTPETILVSMMYVNNEVGAILPIQDAAEIISRNKNTIFHVDAVQAFGKVDLIPNLKGIDLLSMSSHKIHGPKGVGALFIRDKVRLEPLFQGGGQEKGARSGTENLPGIVGFGVATEEAFNKNTSNMRRLKEKLAEDVLREIPDTVLNSPTSHVAPHIANISFLGTRGEILLHSLETKGIYVSTGSACSSHKVGVSHVLQAMGKSHQEIEGAVRFSLSSYITEDDIDYTVETLKKEVENIRKVLRR
jgi:cysteine desulfurase